MKAQKRWLAVVIGTALVFPSIAGDVPRLGIYAVSREPKPGWHYFDSVKFPNLGYIAGQPDILITRIKNVDIESVRQSAELADEWRRTLVIEFLPDDAKRLSAVVTANLGGQTLFLLGNQPLFAPMIGAAGFEGPSFAIVLPPELDPKKVKAELEQLCQ